MDRHDGRIDRAGLSHVGDFEFGSRLSQTDDLKKYTCHFLGCYLALIGWGKNWLEHCQDNVTEWDIGSLCWWPDFPVR